MIPLEQISSFIVLHLFMLIMPGLNTALVIRNSLRFGCRAGVLSAIGITYAITLHALFAFLATNVIVQLFNEYFFVIKVVGVMWVAGFGLHLIKNYWRGAQLVALAPVDVPAEAPTTSMTVRMGFFLDLFNPYIALFYLSIAPSYMQHCDPKIAIPLLVSIVGMVNLLWFSSLSYVVAYTKTRFSIPTKYLEFCTGVAMLCFSILLLLKG